MKKNEIPVVKAPSVKALPVKALPVKALPVKKWTAANQIWMIVSGFLLVILIVYVIIYPPGASSNPVLAKVNNVSITKNQLYDFVYSSSGDKALQTLIEKELIQQEGNKAGLSVTDAEVDAEINNIRQTFQTDEEFAQALLYYGTTLDQMKDDFGVQILLKKLLQPQVTVSDDEVKQYYDDNLETLKTPETIKVAHILVKTKAEADAVLTELKNGKDFAAVAAAKSIDTATKDLGGEMEVFAKGTVDETFETAAFALANGKLSEVVETSAGFHVIKLLERNKPSTPTLEEKKVEIHEQLNSQKLNDLSATWLEQKKAAANIQEY